MIGVPQTSEVVRVDGGVIARGLLIRVVFTETSYSTPAGTVWLTGYVLDQHGDAVERREMYLDLSHLTLIRETRRPTGARPAPVVRNQGPVRVPIQRSNARPAAEQRRVRAGGAS
jgi:hypothetical protein